MTKRLEQEKIDEIKQLSKEWLSTREIADLLGVWSTSVHKYLRWTEKTTKEVEEVFSSLDKKKLELIKDLTPRQIQEILHHNAIATRSDKVDINTEEIWHAIFWAIGDTHQGSKAHNNDWLHRYYDRLQEKGIKTVFHAGDIADWYNVYKGHAFELSHHWADAQAEDIIQNYPKRDWMETYFIGWNHDESLLQLAWYDIGKYVDKMREDMHYLWFYNARIMLNGVDIELQHWGGSNSYARSYKPQKYLENADPKNQPNVFLLGHYHTALYMFYRKIHTFMVWAFQWETNLTKRFKLGNTQGWWVVEVTLDNKGWTTINMEFIKV